jgi:hypothetical protein
MRADGTHAPSKFAPAGQSTGQADTGKHARKWQQAATGCLKIE